MVPADASWGVSMFIEPNPTSHGNRSSNLDWRGIEGFISICRVPIASYTATVSVMQTFERLHREQTFHDDQARERARHFARHPEQLQFRDEDYLGHESWIAPALALLGDVRGLNVLDCGCGHGMAAVVLARRGAHVVGCDLSLGYLHEARLRAQANDVTIHWAKADGQRLPFADGAFDRIWGNAILHHLDMRLAAEEIHRLLKPGGRAVFCEPWGENPVLNLARRRLPYPGKGRTPDETPLRDRDVEVLRSVFPFVSVHGFQLLGMAQRFLGKGRLGRQLQHWDERILKRFPSLQRWCRYVVVCLEKLALSEASSSSRQA